MDEKLEKEYEYDKYLYKSNWLSPITTENMRIKIKAYYMRTYGTDDVIKLFGEADSYDYTNQSELE